MDQFLTLTVLLVLLIFCAGVLAQVTGAMFGHRPDWLASLRWFTRGLRQGAYQLLMAVANMFRDAGREINRSARNQPMWQRLIFGIIALLPFSVGMIFWLPAQIIRPPGRKK